MNIADIISLAAEGAGGIRTATQIVESLQKVFRSPKPDLVAAERQLYDVFKQLNEAQRNQMTVERLLAELKKQLDQQDRFALQAARYQLVETDMGGLVYALKKDDPSGDPPHEICATCFDQQIKSVLQFSPERRNTLVCPRCGTSVLKDDKRGSGIMVAPSPRSVFDDY